jgi:phosphoglycerol transferase MdoB-like AlkP superfamily enzyme
MKEKQLVRNITYLLQAKIDFILLVAIFAWKVPLFYRIVNMNLDIIVYAISLLAVATLLICRNALPFAFRFAYVMLVDLVLSTLMFIDSIYLSYFHDVTSVSLLRQIGQVSELGGSIWTLVDGRYAFYFADIPLLILLYYTKMKQMLSAHRGPVWKTASRIFAMVIVFLLVFGSTINIERTLAKVPSLLDSRYSNKAVLKELGIYHYHLFDVYQYVNRALKNRKATPEEINDVKNWFAAENVKWQTGPLFGKANGQNLIVIQEESLQAFVVNLKINGQEVTPNLNKLIREGVYYSNYYDQTYHGRTSDGEFTSLVSLYPSSVPGSIYFNFAENEFDSLPKTLKQAGYTTFSAHAYAGSYWNRAVMHRNLGFEQSMFMESLEKGEKVGWGLSDGDFFKQMGEKLKELPQPFFAFLVSLSNHHPYNEVPAAYKTLQLGELEGTMMGDYLHSVHYADQALGEFIESLKKSGLYDSSVLAVYGDHDAGLPNEELARIGIQPQYGQQYDKVPLVIHSSALGKKNGTVDEQVAGHLDLTPSLLYLLGIPQEGHYFMGQRLFDVPSGNNKLVVFRDGSYVTQNHVFVVQNGMLEEGRFLDRISGKPVDREMPQQDTLAAQTRLRISDLILESNLIPSLQTKQEQQSSDD